MRFCLKFQIVTLDTSGDYAGKGMKDPRTQLIDSTEHQVEKQSKELLKHPSEQPNLPEKYKLSPEGASLLKFLKSEI
jgi:hypothetical protein